MLEVTGLTFAYAGSKPLYDGFSLTVEPGERVALSAPSGFGKTTLCLLLAGYLKPDGGSILIDGAPLPRKGVRPVQLIGQHPEQVLDPRMRMEASLSEAGGPDAGLLKALGIEHRWLSRYPHELSGGQLQRFCIARALLANPRYLIADEISTMLDAVTQARLWHLLIEEADRRNLGMVLVSHSPALTKRVATRTVELV